MCCRSPTPAPSRTCRDRPSRASPSPAARHHRRQFGHLHSHRPAGRTVDLVGRSRQRDAHGTLRLLGHRDGHRLPGADGHGVVHLERHQHGDGRQPGNQSTVRARPSPPSPTRPPTPSRVPPSPGRPPACPPGCRSTPPPARSPGRPTTAVHVLGHHQGHRRWAATSAPTSFTWTVTNTVTVDQPGHQVNVTGTAITAARQLGHRLPVGRHPLLVGHRPARRTVDQHLHRLDHRHAHHRLRVLGHPQRHRRRRLLRHRPRSPGRSPTPWRSPTRAPGDRHRLGHHRLADSATDSQSACRPSPGRPPACPPGLSINPRPARSPARPPRPGTSSVDPDRHRPAGHRHRPPSRGPSPTRSAVTNPGNKSGSRAPPSPPSRLGHRLPVRPDADVVGHRPARRAVDQHAPPGPSPARPTTRLHCSVTIKATDGAGFFGTTSFSWTVTNTRGGHQPGHRTSVTGSAISPADRSRPRTPSPGPSLTWSATGLPAGLSINTSTGTVSGTPDHAVHLLGDPDRHRHAGPVRDGHLHLDRRQPVTVDQPGTQTGTSGTAITTLTASATDSRPAPRSRGRPPACRPACRSTPSPGRSPGRRPPPAPARSTLTATDGAGSAGSATFTWTITNTVTVAGHGAQSSTSGTAITAADQLGHRLVVRRATSRGPPPACPPACRSTPRPGTISGTPTTAG